MELAAGLDPERSPCLIDGVTARGSFRQVMAEAWRCFGGRILLVISGADLTAQEFEGVVRRSVDWQGALSRPNVRRIDVPEADHTFSRREHRLVMEAALLRWLGESMTGPCQPIGHIQGAIHP